MPCYVFFSTFLVTFKLYSGNTKCSELCIKRRNLRQSGLEGAIERSGFHMLWNETLRSQNMQRDPFTRWAQMLVNFFVSLYRIQKKSY